MDVKITLNGKMITDSVDADMVLLDFCRKHNCYSVKRGCESGNCGLCTVLLDGKPILSCSTPVGRANGRRVDTLEGLQEEAKAFTRFFAAQGADQCGFCNPFMAGAFHGVTEADEIINVGVSGPGVMRKALESAHGLDFGALCEKIKKTAVVEMTVKNYFIVGNMIEK